MTEHQGSAAPVGSVAEEAARLMDALGSWAQSGAAGHEHDRDSDHAAADEAPSTGAAADEEAADDAPPADAAADGATCASCGARAGVGRAESCRACPVCQGISVLRSVRPETVERLADFAAVVANALREMAVQRRGDDPVPCADPPGDSGRAAVQDIEVRGTPDVGPPERGSTNKERRR